MARIHATLARRNMTGEAFALFSLLRVYPELYFYSRDLEEINEGFVDELNGQIANYGFKPGVHAPFMSLDIGADDQNLRQHTLKLLQNTVKLAAKIQAEYVVVHPGYGDMAAERDFAAWLERAVEPLKLLCQLASDLNIRLAFENIYDSSSERLQRLLAAIDSSSAGICFDTGHFNLFATQTMHQWLGQLSEQIIVCHVHDNDKSGDQHLPIGDGCIDYQPLINWYKGLSVDKKPIMTLEALNKIDLGKSVEQIGRWQL